MDNMLAALLKGFEKYYNTVTNIGSINNTSVNKLVIASWIYDVLKGDYGIIDGKQYSLLQELYNCIEGDCLVPYQKYCNDIWVNVNPKNDYVRITEAATYDLEDNPSGNQFRFTEDTENLRTL